MRTLVAPPLELRPRDPGARRYFAVLGILAVLLASVLTYVVEASPAEAATIHTYAALGDSYSSGEGVTPNDSEWDPGTAGGCHRSPKAWARKLASDSSNGLSLTAWPAAAPYKVAGHLACSGAKTSDILSDVHSGEQPQLTKLNQLSPGPELVTVTIGGNDVGFASALKECYQNKIFGNCTKNLGESQTKIQNELGPKLTKTYQAIMNSGRRPRLVVVGYPQIINGSVAAYGLCPWASPGTLGKMRDMAGLLNGKIREIALSTGAEYVDVTDTLKDHELCSAQPSWVRSITILSGGMNTISGHPMEEGQTAIMAKVASYLKDHPFPPPAPTPPATAPTLNVTGSTSNSVSLSWNRVTSAVGYRIYMDGQPVLSPLDPATTATVVGLSPSRSYSFTVAAYNTAGEGPKSAPKTGATAAPPVVVPGTPTLSSTGKSASSVSLSWTKPSGATGFKVYVDGALKTSPTGTTTTVTGLQPSTSYSFQVKATNSAGESPASNVVSVKTLDSYTYSFVSQSASGDPAHARPGQEFTITLKVKNTGTATWAPDGASPVLLGTTRPNDHVSAMQASGWVTSTRPARLQESSVANGQTGTFVFPVKTPDKAGSLTEYFTLVAENTSWFNDAGVSVTITTTPIVGTAARPGTNGQWNVASDGGVFAENGAPFFGSKGGQALNAPIVGIAATKSGNGYWLVGADGGVFAYGDAGFAGSTAGQALNRPIVGIAGTPSGQGYWLVGADGGVFAYGDAQFYGSMGGKPLNTGIVGIASTPSGQGYWLVGADGGVFAYGDAQFTGSMVDKPLNKPINGIASDGTSGGYFLVGGDGGIYAFGSAHFLGSAGSGGTARTTVGMTVRAAGYLTIDNAGTSLFYDGTVSVPPPPPPPPPPPAEPTTLYANQALSVGARLVSGNGQYVLVMQGDGNLVEYAPGSRPVWASGTGVPGTVLVNQSDGNLVLVAPGGQPVWATGTNGNPDSVLVVQDDANIVVIAPGNRPIWASGTRL